MLMTKYRSNYINTLTHGHGWETLIKSDRFKRHGRFTNNVVFDFSWNVTSKIKYERDWERLFKCLGAKSPGKEQVALGKGLLLALVRDLNEIALTLLEKTLMQ